jgi:hypothetical protein
MLVFTVRVIVESDAEHRQRIADAYQDARTLVATIELDDKGSARPRIVACFERFRAYKAADDVAAAGWILTAMQERVAEGDLPGWRQLRKIIKGTVRGLPPRRKDGAELTP